MSYTVSLLYKQKISDQLTGSKRVYPGYLLIEFASLEHKNVALTYLQGSLEQHYQWTWNHDCIIQFKS